MIQTTSVLVKHLCNEMILTFMLPGVIEFPISGRSFDRRNIVFSRFSGVGWIWSRSSFSHFNLLRYNIPAPDDLTVIYHRYPQNRSYYHMIIFLKFFPGVINYIPIYSVDFIGITKAMIMARDAQESQIYYVNKSSHDVTSSSNSHFLERFCHNRFNEPVN